LLAPAEVDSAVAFLTSRLLDKRGRLGEEAYLVAAMEVTSLKLRKAAALAGDAPALTALLEAAKAELAAGRALLEALPEGADPVAHAAYHRTAAEYHKLRGPAAAFYTEALAWLAHVPLDALPTAVKAELAVDIALAALVGEGVYNFGEGAL
jgi:26S proteasome regulatory subunit N9